MATEARTYRILGLLGEGGFGKVYRARLEDGGGFQQEVALKLLHDEDPDETVLQRFRDEARILGLVRDRAFVSVSPPVRLEGRWGVVMEYVQGVTLEALLRRFGPLPPGVAAGIVGEVARALHAVGEQTGPDGQPIELIHRDLKPANLQITRTGEVKVLDFGIARATFQRREFQTQASIGGTPGYIAPERLRGIEDPAGDIYSMGVVLAHCVAGSEVGNDPATWTVTGTATSTSWDAEDSGRELPSGATDGAGAELLALAEAMCAARPEARPTARQVERRCAEIARAAGVGLREWAENHVPDLGSEPASDGLIGRELVTTLQERTEGVPVAPPAASGPSRGLLAGAAASVVVVVLGLAWVLGGGSVAPVEAPEPAPVAAPDPGPAPAPEPAPEVAPEPAPEVAPEPAPAVVPAPAPASRPEPAGAPARVWVKTKPFGRVRVDGKEAATDQWIDGVRGGARVLELRANDGRTHDWRVTVEPGEDNRFCWDFEKGAPC